MVLTCEITMSQQRKTRVSLRNTAQREEEFEITRFLENRHHWKFYRNGMWCCEYKSTKRKQCTFVIHRKLIHEESGMAGRARKKFTG